MSTPSVLWQPAPDAARTTRIGDFQRYCAERFGAPVDGYDQFWEWSVGDGLEDLWQGIWDYFEIASSVPFSTVVDRRVMPGANWFVDARLNYAEHILAQGTGRGDDVALVSVSQTRDRQTTSWTELTVAVERARNGLIALGVTEGDRVAAYLPNISETIVAFLATASLGAIWTSCAPEFGVSAVLDRLSQVEPKVLFAVDGYAYGAKDISRVENLAEIRAGLPSLDATVRVPYGPDRGPCDGAINWDDFLGDPGPFTCAQVAPDHPLYVLYSSGTTGMPKAIIHGHGGVLAEHLKVVGLHCDMGPDDVLFWFTTTGWMMWNFVVSGLLVGARLVLFDGDPNADGPQTLWCLPEQEGVTWFGVGAPFHTASHKAGLVPKDEFDLSTVRCIGATGAPLPPESAQWIYENVSDTAMLSAISGGTDVCSAFVGGNPLTPVWQGEIPARYLGCAVYAFDEAGNSVVGQQGELVLTEPMPSMPIGFWGDDDGSRYSAAYFEDFPGYWRHGDWITVHERGSVQISGRSDATLNRGGVRVGTAEIYRVAESLPGVANSMVVHLEASDASDPGVLVLFVQTTPGVTVDADFVKAVRSGLRSGLSPRHVPDEVHEVSGIPTTLSGKKIELPVKKILLGGRADDVASRGSLKNPDTLDEIVRIADSRTV